jgi:lysophospholipid acyltransferase (LPLAT)-like uncharacterized protein
MRISLPILNRFAGFVASSVVRAWLGTLDHRVAYYDPSVDPARPEFTGQYIYVFWHEYLLAPIYGRGHCNVAMLLSRHRDAEILGQAAKFLGFETVRGSTRRGGLAALREMLVKSQRMNLVITPDGPRGPRRVLAPGAVYLASKLQRPLVPFGAGYERPWRAKSWDRFAIPRPFSRGRYVVGPPMNIPADLSREGIEHYRAQAERMLNFLTDEAEQWAATGRRKPEEFIGNRAADRGRFRRAA